ncbi:Methylated-DNA-[protein]-cysteine S-methyltransferase, DNA binding [Phytophthora cactorum]|nr:Methylated-DNA-[protein]-cysteine S-methyltransferase, DNA binding [Phytophthora cactorum]
MTVRRVETKKTPAKTEQKRKPGITTKSKPKSTQHILWRGKQITERCILDHDVSVRPYVYVLLQAYNQKGNQLMSHCIELPLLQKNPFAPEVPCHRVVAAALDIGGFQGATGEDSPYIQKKRTLLAKEGVRFTKEHKVRATP